ncbi:U-box domain-containing protein 45-like [Wolffia australiana]
MDHVAGEMDQGSQDLSARKVFGSLCGELSKILDMIVPVIPIIESAHPGGTAGIRELCFLNNEIAKTKLLLLHLTESSCFYLAMTAEAVILRCERRRNALHESLSRLLGMLPDYLADKVAEILLRLGSAKFSINPAVEGAGRGIFSIIKQTTPEEAEFKAFCDAAQKLDVMSPRARLVEKRSIKKLLNQLRGSDPQKEVALKFLLFLFKKYEKRLLSENLGQILEDLREELASEAEQPESMSTNGVMNQKRDQSLDSPPKEFICPLSMELMQDPVVIASGQTYERSAIAKWFLDGHDVCPKTGKKMTNFAMVPNSCMRTLISNWREGRGISTLDMPAPSLSTELEVPHSFNSLNSCSITSFKTFSATNVRSRIADFDFSNVSTLSAESSFAPHTLPEIDEGNGNGSPYYKFLSDLADLAPEPQAKALAELESQLQNDQERKSILSEGFLDALVQFLGSTNSKEIGLQILSTLLQESRVESAETYKTFLSLLNTELGEVQELAMEILCKGKKKKEVVAQVCSADGGLVGSSLKLLHKLSVTEEWRAAIVEVEGCVAEVAEVLDLGSREEQADAAGILLGLCLTGTENRVMVMKEGVIPALVHISVNGSSEGRACAKELLHLLRDVRDEDQELTIVSFSLPDNGLETIETIPVVHRKRGFFGKMFRSKPWSLALF